MLQQTISGIKNKLKSPPRLQTILLIFFLVMELCVISIIGICTFTTFSNKMVVQLANSRTDFLEQISRKLDSLSNIMISFSDLYYYNEPLNSMFKKTMTPADYSSISKKLNVFNTQYKKALVTNGLPLEYAIIAKDYCYHSVYKNQQVKMDDYNVVLWRYNFLKSASETAWISTYTDIWSAGQTTEHRAFSFARGLSCTNNGTVAYFLVNASEDILYQTYKESLTQNNSIYIVNNDGQIVSHRDKNMLGLYFYRMDKLMNLFDGKNYAVITKNGSKYLLSKVYNKNFDWTILEEIPMSVVLKPLYQLQSTMLLIYIGLLIVEVIVAYRLSYHIALPLKRLCTKLKQVATSEEGNVRFIINSWRELGEISDECNYMSNRIDTLVNNIKNNEKLIREAELRFLYAQINPHFMHNTLFSLKCLIAMNRNTEAEKMLSEFSALLGSILQPSDQLIPIEQELYILNRYIMVQKIQHGDHISFQINCSEENLNYLVPKLLLQPLIENSIFHGFSSGCADGLIKVTVRTDNKHLYIDIGDNGLGFDTSVLHLNDSTGFPTKSSAHIGVQNVQNRIRLLFGNQYGLNIQSEIGKGTWITVDIPKLDNIKKKQEV